jgi:hypothetical protein
MSDKTYIVKDQGQGQTVTNLKKHLTLEVTSISKDDTITVAALTTANKAVVIDLADATEYTATVLTNVITITDVLCVTKHVIVLVVGV